MAIGGAPVWESTEAPAAEMADTRMERVERLFERVSDGLTRWLGPYGVHALMTRALARVRPAHPALAGVAVAGRSGITGSPLTHLAGWGAVAREHGIAATMDAAAAVLASLGEQMGRLIGEELATTLLDQSVAMMDPAGSVVYSGGTRSSLRTSIASMAVIDPPGQAGAVQDVPQPDGEHD